MKFARLLAGGIASLALCALLAGPSSGAPWNVVTSGRPDMSGGVVLCDTTLAIANAVTDTLMFGFLPTDVCVWTAAGSGAAVKWAPWYPISRTALKNTSGTTPPAAARQKQRWGAPRFSSAAHTFGTSDNYCLPEGMKGLVAGIIVTGATGCTLHVMAVKKD